MLRTIKPRNARSKRALEAREPKEIEDVRTAVFVRGTRTGSVVQNAMKELMLLKKPHAIAFSKRNAVRPFEDASPIGFWAAKNDASMFVVGQSTKKRPDGMVLVRTFDGRVLDMCEVGVARFVSMAAFKTPTPTVGHKPMLHFASELFETHPRYVQLKSLLVALLNGEVIESVCLPGLEHVVSVTAAPLPADHHTTEGQEGAALPVVHVRTYAVARTASGTRVPRVALTEMGPALDLTLRRCQVADPDLWAAAMKRPRMRKEDVQKGLGKRKKNVEVDAMGDVRGRIHVGRQDLERLQTRKMKGLKRASGEEHDDGDEEEEEEMRRKRSRQY